MEEKLELNSDLKEKFMKLIDEEQLENVNGGNESLGERYVLCPKDNSRMRYDSCTGTFTCIYGHTWF